MKNSSLKRTVLVGLMAAMVFVGTYIRITIPTPLGPTMLHLGNVMCILSGLILGPVSGGLAAGIGSAIFDLLDPNFAAEFWITFIMKGFYGLVVGLISHSGGADGLVRKRNIAAAIIGALGYTAIYTLKNYIMMHLVLGNPMTAVKPVLITKATVSLGNAVVAVLLALFLHEAVGKRVNLKQI